MRFCGWREAVISVFFPRHCPVCEGIVMPRGELICSQCAKELSPVSQPLCLRCGKELESDQMEYCYDCSRHQRSFERNFALLNYDDKARNSMVAIKYKNRREYLDFYGKAICVRYGRQLHWIRPEIIVPVPVHPSRKRIRGFNQAEVLAEIIGDELGIPVCPDVLRRSKKTAPQKELNPVERLRNLEQACVPGKLPEKKNGKIETVLVVDDIYTTGSTLEACTRVLKRMGVKKVYGVTICIGEMA